MERVHSLDVDCEVSVHPEPSFKRSIAEEVKAVDIDDEVSIQSEQPSLKSLLEIQSVNIASEASVQPVPAKKGYWAHARAYLTMSSWLHRHVEVPVRAEPSSSSKRPSVKGSLSVDIPDEVSIQPDPCMQARTSLKSSVQNDQTEVLVQIEAAYDKRRTPMEEDVVLPGQALS